METVLFDRTDNISDLPNSLISRQWKDWIEFYEYLTTHVNLDQHETFFIRYYLSAVNANNYVDSDSYRIADLKKRVFDQLWRHRLTYDELITIRNVSDRYDQMLRSQAKPLDSLSQKLTAILIKRQQA